MNIKLTGLRSVAAASGVALLMAVSACGGSDASNDDAAVEQDGGAGGSEADGSAGEAEEGAGEENEAGGGEAEQAEQTEEAAAGGDAVTLAADFDPCEVLSADDINKVTGGEFNEGNSSDLAGTTLCSFMPADALDASVIMVQMLPVEGHFDEAMENATGTFASVDEIVDVDVPGASQAKGYTGDLGESTASSVMAEVGGGLLQVVISFDGATVDQATELASLTLANA